MKSLKGFTLVELLVTLSIVIVLTALTIASISTIRIRNSDTAVKANLKTIQLKAESFYYSPAHQNKYTTSVSNSNTVFGVSIFGCTDSNGLRSGDAPRLKFTFLGYAVGALDQSTYNALKKVYNASDKTKKMYCYVPGDGTGYSIAVPLRGGGAWCIDSKGTFQEYDNVLGTNAALDNETDATCN
ncbi:MAG TPA: prepilin-type N-terminal cleavage/methylation domain-containing protein [Candidatus Paceibacterota bacterium]|nr:prepilin-type N-terminal cleavage/methylation domain-containing protein [Candidatus Paceibacterota bacterium]